MKVHRKFVCYDILNGICIKLVILVHLLVYFNKILVFYFYDTFLVILRWLQRM